MGLCIHQLLWDALNFPQTKIDQRLRINNQPYNFFFLQGHRTLISNFLLENEFPRLATKICHVYCNIIKPYQFDNQHCQIIRSISLPRSNTYHFNSLKTQQILD